MKTNKKTVNIFTLHANSNFGNKLQNYAVTKLCTDLNLNVVSQINYYGGIGRIKNKYAIKILNRYRLFKRDIINKEKYRNINFKIFEKQYLKPTKKIIFSNENNDNYLKKYDYFIVGSDQVWNPYFGLMGQFRFLTFAPKEKCISLSASIGVDYIPEENIYDFKNGINHLNHISVREDKAKQLINNISERKVEVLCDPTMMLTKKEWTKLCKKPAMLKKKNFIICYFLGVISEERKTIIENYAKEKNYEVINILDKESPYYECGPSEFLYLEKNAKIILTDSFHSSVFGIIFETPFLIYEREDNIISMNSRISTLLNKFKLKNRTYKNKLTDKELICNYKHTKDILEKERLKGIDFLKKSLNINEN